MAQKGQVYRSGKSWFLRYRETSVKGGQRVRRQKCVKLAEYSDRYRTKADLADLAAEKLAGVKEADKCPHSSDLFSEYVEETYLPFVLRTMKPSTYSGYSTYWKRYLKPRVGKYALRDFTVALVSSLLEDIAASHELNKDTIGKVRSIISGIFSYAIGKGHFPAKSASENPASRALIPESATEPGEPEAATRDEVKAILAALKAQPSLERPELPLARAAVALGAMCGLGPAELRGLRWSDWDRVKQQIHVQRNYWHTFEGTTKTKKRVRFVAATAELRDILLALWKEQCSPLDGYILAAPEEKSKPVILDNLAKRTIRPRIDAVRETTEEGEKTALTWPGWYSLRRFHGTAVRAESNLETTSKALGNSKAIADRHYVKPSEVLRDVRKAVNDAVLGLTVVQ
jgi:integrase